MENSNDVQLEYIEQTALEAISNDSELYLSALDTETRAAAKARISEKRGLVSRLIPTSVEKALDAADANEIEAVAAHKMAILEVHAAARLQKTKQEAGVALRANGMHWATELTAYAAERYGVLSNTLSRAKEDFADRMLEEEAKLAKYASVPELHDAMSDAFRNEIAAYFSLVNELLEQFQDALKTTVGGDGSRR